MNVLEKRGIVFPPSPDTIGEEEKEFPTSFDNIMPNEIMNKIAVFTSLFAYTSVLEATARSEVAALEKELETNESVEYILSDSSQVTTKKALRDISDSVIHTKEKLTLADTRYNILRSMSLNYEKYLFALSRYLTVVVSEMKMQ
jgi:hypothetical protein